MEINMEKDKKEVILAVIEHLMELLQISKAEAVDMLKQVNRRALTRVHEQLDKLHASEEVMNEIQHELEEE